jgi:hypothetical protein
MARILDQIHEHALRNEIACVLPPWNIPPRISSEFGEMQFHEGPVERLTAFLVTFDAARGLGIMEGKYGCKLRLTLPKRDGVTAQCKLFLSTHSSKSLHDARNDLRSLSMRRHVGLNDGIDVSLQDGVMIVKCRFASSVFRPSHLRMLRAAFRATMPLSESEESEVFLGGEIVLKIDKPISETQAFWDKKRRTYLSGL